MYIRIRSRPESPESPESEPLYLKFDGGVQGQKQRSSFLSKRLNSGTRSRHYFFILTSFLYRNIQSDSVDHTESGDIKVFVHFPGNSILKLRGLRPYAWVVNSQNYPMCIFMLVILICEIGGTYLISHQPTQFNPRDFYFLVGFLFKTIFPCRPL